MHLKKNVPHNAINNSPFKSCELMHDFLVAYTRVLILRELVRRSPGIVILTLNNNKNNNNNNNNNNNLYLKRVTQSNGKDHP